MVGTRDSDGGSHFQRPRSAPRPPPPSIGDFSWHHSRYRSFSRPFDLEFTADGELSKQDDPITRPDSTYHPRSGRFSLTPSDITYPMAMFHASPDEGHGKIERILGLRRDSVPPPVPPKPGQSARVFQPWPEPLRLGAHAREKQIWEEGPISQASDGDEMNGRLAWLHALTGMLVVFSCWGLGNAYGLFQAYYETQFPDTNPATISWIGSTQLALVFGLGVPVGRFVDHGYFRTCFHGGTLIMLVGLFATAFCHAIWLLWLVQGLIVGIGMGMVFCSGLIAIMTWFDETRIGLATGMCAAGSCLGGIVYVAVAHHFLVHNTFKTTILVVFGIAAITMVPANLHFRLRSPLHGRRPATATTRVTWHTFADPSYLLAALGMFFAFLGVYFGFVYIILFGRNIYHLSVTASTNLLIAMLAANLPGRFLPALISDRCIGPLNTIIPSLFLSAAVIGLWIGVSDGNNVGALFVVACFYGFVSAGIQVLYAPTVYTFCFNCNDGDEATAVDKMGIKAGGIFSCIGVACLIGTPIGGALVQYRVDRDLEQPFLAAQIFAAACLALGGFLLLASRVCRIGWAARKA